ncbi:hypothetical protein BDV95DRAFT_160348 [Massariosphaeria phaeospora]|uniref:Putative zinc-finger domain-containing protein n=1 Tax=Massariosphaeria phaeospora TaxID=100035 RepID=A0A7C8M2L6_9PLEO|nr:hypothetical protein BDV95DRAFT_160348 [Massariosphaeria phaeospora]
MANYPPPQPPFGLPFAFPPPQPAPMAPAGPPAGPPDPRQAHAEPFPPTFHLPGLSLNSTSYNQNTQQPPYAPWQAPYSPFQHAWGTVPPNYFTALGAVPPPQQNYVPAPPPPPPLPEIPPSHAAAPRPGTSMSFTSMPFGPSLPRPTATNGLAADPMHSDKEDGEVSEGDQMSQSPALQGRLPVQTPRSVPLNLARPQSRNTERSFPPHNDIGGQVSISRKHSLQPPSSPASKRQMAGPLVSDPTPQQRAEAKHFVQVLHNHGFGYESLKHEGLDLGLLEALYKEANLPWKTEHAAPPEPLAVASSPATEGGANPTTSVPSSVKPHSLVVQTKPVIAAKSNVNTSVTPKSATLPEDRKDYIARLQAAKMAKQPAAAKASPTEQAQPVLPTLPASLPAPSPTASTPQPVTPHNITVSKVRPPLTEEEKARNTQRFKEKVASLRAQSAVVASSQVPKASPVTPALSSRPLSSSSQKPETFPSSATHVTGEAAQTTNYSTQPPKTPSFSGIPGLFMGASSSVADAGPSQNSQPLSQLPMGDVEAPAGLNDEAASTSNLWQGAAPHAFKRPGALPWMPSVHPSSTHDDTNGDVVDDVSVGSEQMDMEDDKNSKPSNMPRLPNSRPQQAEHNPPSGLGNAFRPSSSGVSTPGPQTPDTRAQQEELEKRKVELQTRLATAKILLKQRMVEARRQKAADEAAAATGITPFATTQPLGESTSQQSASLLSDPSGAPALVHEAEPVPDSSVPKFSKDVRSRRRAEIESGLPSLDAEIATNTARMAQLTEEMEQLKAKNLRISQDKDRLVQELENLGIDTSGMPHAELQAKKAEIEHEKHVEAVAHQAHHESETEKSDPPSTARASEHPEQLPISKKQTEDDLFSSSTKPPQGHLDPFVPVTNGSQPPPAAETKPTGSNAPVTLPAPAISPTLLDYTEAPSLKPPPVELRPSSPVTTSAPSEARPAETSHSTTPMDEDEEDFYSPELATDIPTVTASSTNEPHPNPRSPSEEGEVDMSESSEDEEEEYEPEVPETIAAPSIPHSQNPDVAERATSSPLHPASSASTSDEEAYEPPEVGQVMIATQPSTLSAVSPSSDRQTGGDEDDLGAMDISTSSSDESDLDSPQPSPQHIENKLVPDDTAPTPPSTTVADDLVPRLHFEDAPTLLPLPLGTEFSAADIVDTERYAPYQSPLRIFKSYRYHPNFLQEVAGGLMSMTYSHQINPNKELCPIETAGGICNDDPDCEGQHFRDMILTGEKLLVQLGTANPGSSPDERQRWNSDLRGVLKTLRQKNLKDPNGIADEIIRYRREFLKDSSRVINISL